MASHSSKALGWVVSAVLLALLGACETATTASAAMSASAGSGTGDSSSSSSTGTGTASAATTAGTGTASGAGTSSGGTGTVRLACPDSGLPGLALSGTETFELAQSCVLGGDLSLSGSASLSVDPGVVLTVIGNLVLTGAASLGIDGGVLGIGNLSSFEHSLSVSDTATLTLVNTRLVTNPGGVDNLTSTLSASDSAKISFDNVTIDAAHNWVLADLSGSSTLSCTNSGTPNEIYLGDHCTVDISGPNTSQGLWLRLTNGSSGTLALPDATAPFSWAAGNATGLDVGWNLTVTDARPVVGIESHAGSSWTVIGADAGVKDTTIGLYLDPPSSPDAGVMLSGLSIGVVGAPTPFALSFPWNAEGNAAPQLTLENVNLGPIAWQIYVGSDNLAGPVPVDATISDSVVNEVGVFAGNAKVIDCTLQLAVLAAVEPGAEIQASADDIWSQTILASGGGTVAVDGSNIHGSLLQASTGGQIAVSNSCALWANGDEPTCDEGPAYLSLLANGGRPSCSPFTTPMQLPLFYVADSTSAIQVAGPANQACMVIDAGSYTPALLIEKSGNPAIGSNEVGTVSCAQLGASTVVAEAFESYPAALIQDATSGDQLVSDAGYACTVIAGAEMNQFQVVAPSCAP